MLWLNDGFLIWSFFELKPGFSTCYWSATCSPHLHDKPHLRQLIAVNKELKQLQELVRDDLLNGQITQLELMAEDVIPEDAESLAATQVKLEYFMTDVTRRFRAVKREIFDLVLELKRFDMPIVN